MRHFCFLLILFAVSACTAPPHFCSPAKESDVVYVVGREWHAEIGIPVEELKGNLAFYRTLFPEARTLMFGYGKKTFFTAPPDTISEYFLGPVPGPAVIHVVGLRVSAAEAYPAEDTITLTLPPGGSKALSAFIWNDLAKNTSGKPTIVSHSTYPAGLFYAANSEYTLWHTCNTWATEALRAAGLPVSSSGVAFSGQVMNRAEKVAESQCR